MTLVNRMALEAAKRYHEECVSKVKKHLEEMGCIVYRTGNFDILSEEEYDSKMPLPLRLSKLSADLKVMKNENDKEAMYNIEVKTEDIQDEQNNLKLNGVQLAYFIHQLNQKGVRTMYFYFQRDGLEKGWFADDLDVLETMLIDEGAAREYIESAIQILKERRKK